MKFPQCVARIGRLSLWMMLAALIGMVGVPVVQAAGIDTSKLISYYRKKANVPPKAAVTVTGLKDSAIKGAKEGTLQLGTPPNVRKVPFTISADGRYVIFGETEDLTVNPFKKVMSKISMKNVHSRGPANAKVTIVEYSDFECPFCERGYNTMEHSVLNQYGNKVRFVYKNFPLSFHPWAELGAVAAECVSEQNPEAFWNVYHLFFNHQKEFNPGNVKDKVESEMKEAKVGKSTFKLNKKKFEDCFDNKKTLPKIKAQIAEGQSVGVRGTPAFIINGRLVSGAQPAQVFKNVIDDELASKD